MEPATSWEVQEGGASLQDLLALNPGLGFRV